MKPHLLALVFAVALPAVLRGGELIELAEADRKALMERAEATQRAFDNGDADAIIQSTHPAILKFFASREQFEVTTRKAVESLKGQVVVEKTELGNPTPLYVSGNDEVCFVPKTSIMRIGQTRGRAEGFLIAARQKETNEWLFLDCAGLRKDSSLLWKLFPDLPKEVPMPPNTIEVLK